MSRKVNVFGGVTIPQPLVKELPQDAAWDEWSRAIEDQDQKFAPTAPSPLPMMMDAEARNDATEPAPLEIHELRAALQARRQRPKPTRAPGEVTLVELLQQLRSDGHVCLQPAQWTKLYVLLAQRRRGTVRLPRPPPTGKVWEATTATARRMSFHDHLEWASRHGCLPEVHAFLEQQPEEAWLRG